MWGRCRDCSIVPIAAHQIQTTGSTRTRRIEQPFHVGPPTTWHSFIYNQRRSHNASRRCALRLDQPQLPEKAHYSRKCVVLPPRFDSKMEKCTTYFSWVCRSWNRTRPSAARRCLSERKRHFFTWRCYSISGKEWTPSTRRRPLQGRNFFRRLATAASRPLIGERHSVSKLDR